ncbi:MAG: hypothetical protein Tsb0020_42750 [Haliangiales bacterium]
MPSAADSQTPRWDLGRAALVVAHPDDEVLWFSAVLSQVGQRVVCFEACDDYPALGPARRKLAAAYPAALPTRWLRVPEPCSLGMVDWSRPVATRYGLALSAAGATEPARARQRAAYDEVRGALSATLASATDVITHNPWGEYGHPDHALVCSAVESLADELGYRVWYSSYVAAKPLPYAATVLDQLAAGPSLAPDRAVIDQLVPLYRQAGCWTWMWPYTVPASEAYLYRHGERRRPGRALSLTYVTMPAGAAPRPRGRG